ncbi:NRT2 ribosyltransferase, partial [Edolisoma coerulescens]|nr:NRT2 ribosyltransferase [Edolisoma coerulescens]
WPLPSMAPLAHTLALLAMTVATTAVKVVPLDMAQDSFDDQYQGCGPAMTAELPALNRSELQQSGHFAKAWALAAAEWRVRTSPGSPLSPAQAIALLAYTAPVPLHQTFNAAVRAAGRSHQEYRDNFHFKTLHFLLTQALAQLRGTQGQQCHDVFRGVHNCQFQAQRGQKVRFGQFASTSPSITTALSFGMDTVFQVHTCHGVAIREFSRYRGEKETFEVTNATGDGKRARIWLRSTGTHSTYNCEWLRGDVTEGTTWGDG